MGGEGRRCGIRGGGGGQEAEVAEQRPTSGLPEGGSSLLVGGQHTCKYLYATFICHFYMPLFTVFCMPLFRRICHFFDPILKKWHIGRTGVPAAEGGAPNAGRLRPPPRKRKPREACPLREVRAPMWRRPRHLPRLWPWQANHRSWRRWPPRRLWPRRRWPRRRWRRMRLRSQRWHAGMQATICA